MSYRCAICTTPAPPKAPRKVWCIYKPDGKIQQELPVCFQCKRLLDDGVPLAELIERHSLPKPSVLVIDPVALDGDEPSPL